MKRTLYVLMILTLCVNLAACIGPQVITTTHGIPNFSEVEHGVYRGGQPTNDDEWKYLHDLGIKTVLKLNFEEEGSDEGATAQNMRVVKASVSPSAKSINFLKFPDYGQIRLAVETLENEDNWPIYVHCSHGQDRTGLVVGLFRVMHDHKDIKEARKEMSEHGFHTFLLGLSEYWKRFRELDGKTLP